MKQKIFKYAGGGRELPTSQKFNERRLQCSFLFERWCQPLGLARDVEC